MATLVQLRVSDTRSMLNREVVVAESTSMYNLHRTLQFCIKPNQSDSTVDGKGFTFTHVPSGLPVKGPKTTQLHRANPTNSMSKVIIGDKFMYKPADRGEYLIEIIATGYGDLQLTYVPRCVSGNADLDVINKKLLVRRFTKTGAGAKKKPPALLCSRFTPAAALWASHMDSMREPLIGGWQMD